MNKNITMALLDICRTCLRQGSGLQTEATTNKMQSIIEVANGCKRNMTIMEMLKMVHPDIKVDIADKLPMSICIDCIQKLLVSYGFIEMYKNSDKNFRQFLEKEEVSDVELNEKNFTDESFYNGDIYGINKYALEIEELNIKGMNKLHKKCYKRPVLQKAIKEEDSSDNETSYLTNPYSDDGDEEWLPKASRKTTKLNKITLTPYGNDDETSDCSISNDELTETTDHDHNEYINPHNNGITAVKIMEVRNDKTRENVISTVEHTETINCNVSNPDHENISIGNITQNENDESTTNDDHNKVSNSDNTNITTENIKEKNGTEPSIPEIGKETVELDDSTISPTRKQPLREKKKMSTKNTITKNKKKKVDNNEVPVKGNISCKECEMVFDNVKLWKKHVRKHKIEKKANNRYECEHCGKGFARKGYYTFHLRIHSGDTPYLCFECGKSFKLLSSYNTHLIRHRGVKNYQCPECPIKFLTSSGLYSHRMVHTKERTFVCDICGSAFHMAAHLRKHKLYHSNVKDFPCDRCDKSFALAEKLRRHMLTHTGEKPYRCIYCEKAFAQSNDHKKHLRLHLGNNIYMCKLCPQRFPMARDMRTHLVSHKDEDDETRERNLKARTEAEKNLEIKLNIK